MEVALGPDNHNLLILVHLSFNPCFRGSRPRTSAIHNNRLDVIMFQSLFSWKSPSDLGHLTSHSSEWMFQSLFSWKSPSDSNRHLRYHLRGLVSILVFVEVALGRFCGCGALNCVQFQSLFSWKSPSDHITYAITVCCILFQSLFSWKSPSDVP